MADMISAADYAKVCGVTLEEAEDALKPKKRGGKTLGPRAVTVLKLLLYGACRTDMLWRAMGNPKNGDHPLLKRLTDKGLITSPKKGLWEIADREAAMKIVDGR